MTNPRLFVLACLVLCGGFASIGRSPAQHSTKTWSPVIPKTWDDEAMLSLELPLADPAASPKHVSSDYYYRIPVRPIYKSYPVYYPANEPAAYLDWLKKQEPKIVFDASTLKTEGDWVAAGELVFDAPIEFVSEGTLFSEVRGTAWGK
ncbi:MAG TPA: hypothetical protein VNS63_18170 [Blastocatellia bacterium]|nr:hypothetical protein [Blastocatellia bacterium]